MLELGWGHEGGHMAGAAVKTGTGSGTVLLGAAALVTGASRGLGAALARRLASEGARVVLVARGAEELTRVADEIRAAGGEAHALAADVGDKEAVHAIAGAAAALVGPVDLLVHNASTLGPTPLPLLLDTECEDLERVLAVNLVGPFRLTKVVAGSMVLRGRGTVVHVTSDAATSAYPRWGAYGVSKAALEHLGRIWTAELEGSGVRFLAFDPGEMDTQMHRDAIPDADPATLADPADVAARLVALLRGGAGAGAGAAPRAREEALS
jgi:NAD(P)-dependent dehydrogenase (short-subunit alcohol dehydrogenase family)